MSGPLFICESKAPRTCSYCGKFIWPISVWRGLHTNYQALESAVRSLLKKLQKLERVKLGMPYGIGCGLAGGDWNIVYSMLSRLSDEYGIDIHLYKLK